ncbi:MAG: RHS repeat domain-containing protein, partial [Gemmatimonas sp.]
MTISRRTLFAQLALAGLVQALLSPGQAAAETITFTYDAQGRVTRTVYSNGATIDYSYDAAGNRSQVVRAGGIAPPPPPPPFVQTLQITGTGPVNLRTLANAAGYTGLQDATVTFQLGSGVTIAGTVNGGAGIDTGAWPIGVYNISLTLQISGKAYGGGGPGGGGNGGAGGIGGDALYCRAPLTVTVNAGGELKAGGGGGGGGGRDRINQGGEWFFYGGG